MARIQDPSQGATEGEVAIPVQAGPILIPDAEALFQGQYERDGRDLVIEGPSGGVYRVLDYFAGGTQHDLTSESGAVITGDIATRLAGPQAPLAFAQAGPSAGLQPIGQVETLEGSAFATRANGQRVSLQVGDPVFEDDLVETGDGSNLGITFIDETVFSLSPNARMVLDELVYEAGGSNNSMVMNLVQGTFVFITGQVAPTGDMVVETPVATVGIRGTTPILVIDGRNGATQFGILQDPGGGVGAYVVRDKQTGQIIGEVVDEATIFQLDQVGGPLEPVTLDAAGLADRLAAQSNAYFVYTAARTRIDGRAPDVTDPNPAPAPDQPGQDGTDPIRTESIDDARGPGSGGLNDFVVDFVGLGFTPPSTGPSAASIPPGIPAGSGGPVGPQPIPDTNIPATAVDLVFQLSEDDLISRGAFAASDPDGPGALRFEIVEQPEFGAVVSNGDGTFSYIADPAFQTLAEGETTAVSFSYRAIDEFGASANTATVTLQVAGRNDSPLATPIDVNVTDEADDLITIDLFEGIFDPDSGDILQIKDVRVGSTIDPNREFLIRVDEQNGTVTFDPNDFSDLEENELETFAVDYTAVDSLGEEVSNTATVTITGVNNGPIAKDDGLGGELTVRSGGSITIPVDFLLRNDFDPEGNEFDLTEVFAASDGVAVLDTSSGIPTVIFTADKTAVDGSTIGFDYRVTDTLGADGFGTVEIIVDNMQNV